MKKLKNLLSPFIWAMGVSWRCNKILFSLVSASNLLTSSLSGIINTYLLAQTTASVALLAISAVTIRTPIIWALILGGVAIFFDLVRRITSYYETKFNEQLELHIYDMYIEKVSSFTQEQLDDADLQKSLSMAGREMYSVKQASNILQSIASSFIAYVLAIIVVWQYAWGIGLLLSILVPVLAISSFYQTKRRRHSWEESTVQWRISAGLFNYLTDPMRLFQIKIMGAKDNLIKLRKLYKNKEISIMLEAEKKNTYLALVEDITSPLVEIGTRIWAIILVGSGRIMFDQFLFVMGLIQQASSQTFMLGYSISNAQESYLATSALQEVMNIPNVPNGTTLLDKTPNSGIDINLHNVSLNYPNGLKALDDVNIHISSGQKVAIVGENGAGKTSLLRLITRQYTPTTGSIELNGVDINNLDINSLYSQTSLLSQDYYLIEDLTIKQNLEVVAGKDLSNSAIEKALQTVDLNKKIQSLEHKLNTRLDKSYKDGADLSGGQKQRLSIARALLKPYNLLVLDEPTSAVDAKAERHIFNSIFESSKNATVLIVSHRFATVRKADYIFVLHEGKVIEQGTHQDLIKKAGHYAELYNIQAQDFA